MRLLADEVGVPVRGRNADLNATDFATLLGTVLESCATPEQRQRAQDVRDHYQAAVAWIRHREVTTRPPMPWQETVEDYGARLRAVVQDINDHLDVEGLCKALPKRIQQLRDAEGDRICH